jgi:hypothetical protein
MLQYILVLCAVMAVIGEPVLEQLAFGGFATDYLVAFGVALLLKPWLENHLE